MSLLLATLLLPFAMHFEAQAQEAPGGAETTFTLAGDRLGETFASFSSRHPTAQCVESASARKNCYQWAGVSLMGMAAHPSRDCSVKTHTALACLEGLTAQFVDGRLTMLSYAVESADKTHAVDELKKRYGAPKMDTREAVIWSLGNATLSVVVGKASDEPNSPTLLTVAIAG